MESNDSAEPKRLTGRKGEFHFEMWVEIEGKPLEIYAVTQGADGTPEAWIASEIGKVSPHVCSMRACLILVPLLILFRSVMKCVRLSHLVYR
jgi:hypothetical protein